MYECGHVDCLYRAPRYMVKNHYLEQHMSLRDVPYLCVLCGGRFGMKVKADGHLKAHGQPFKDTFDGTYEDMAEPPMRRLSDEEDRRARSKDRSEQLKGLLSPGHSSAPKQKSTAGPVEETITVVEVHGVDSSLTKKLTMTNSQAKPAEDSQSDHPDSVVHAIVEALGVGSGGESLPVESPKEEPPAKKRRIVGTLVPLHKTEANLVLDPVCDLHSSPPPPLETVTPTGSTKETKTAPPAVATVGRNLLEIDLFGECSEDEEEEEEMPLQPPPEPVPVCPPAINKAQEDPRERRDHVLAEALQGLTREVRSIAQHLRELVKGQQDLTIYARRTAHALEALRPLPPPSAPPAPSPRSRYNRH